MTLNDLTQEQLDELTRVVRRVARSVAFNWPVTVVGDDLEQELWLEILQKPSTLKALVEADPPLRYRLLVRLGHRSAGNARDTYEFFTGNFRYSVDDVKRLLLKGALDTDVVPDSSSGLDLEASLSALWETTPQYAEAITTRYSEKWESPESRSGQHALERGLTALTDGMNRNSRARDAAHVGPGNRTVISNAAARAISEES